MVSFISGVLAAAAGSAASATTERKGGGSTSETRRASTPSSTFSEMDGRDLVRQMDDSLGDLSDKWMREMRGGGNTSENSRASTSSSTRRSGQVAEESFRDRDQTSGGLLNPTYAALDDNTRQLAELVRQIGGNK